MTKTTSTYIDNYNILEEIASNLDSQEVADIDKILPEIDRATKAYNECMDRINKVKAVLESQSKKSL